VLGEMLGRSLWEPETPPHNPRLSTS